MAPPYSQGHAGNPVGSVVTYRFERVTAGAAVTVLYGGTFTATHDETFNLTYLAGALPNTAAAHAAGRPDVLAVLAGLMFALGGCLVAARSRGKAT